MKFAKEIERDLVPEWRLKYLEYKEGKKLIKDISRALARINQTPRLASLRAKTPTRSPFNLLNALDAAGVKSPPNAQDSLVEQLVRDRMASPNMKANSAKSPQDPSSKGKSPQQPGSARRVRWSAKDKSTVGERSPLRVDSISQGNGQSPAYGSILTSPAIKSAPVGPPSLELPDPALSLTEPAVRTRASFEDTPVPGIRRAATVAGDAYEVGRTHTPSKFGVGKLPKRISALHPRRTFSLPYGGPNVRSPFLQRIFHPHAKDSKRRSDVPLEAYGEFDLAQANFYNFLDQELEKVEAFYKEKEEEALERFEKLHEQLRIMRDRRVHELLDAQKPGSSQDGDHQEHDHKKRPPLLPLHSDTVDEGRDWIRPLENVIGLKKNRVGKNSKALQDMVIQKQNGGTNITQNPSNDAWQDYSRRPVSEEVPYRVAKRKLKVALQEYYRGLELLRSYALLNRTAFRKINKKYDKAVMARPPYRYMSERVNKSWFVASERLERLIVDCEDLYSRYFERGNHKIAVNKLRTQTGKGSYSDVVFRNGIMFASGLILGAQGAVNAFEINTNPSDPVKGIWASYLLQLYGGYALATLLFLLFALDCRQWIKSKINYVFVFEFDARHNLDWRQLAEIPCFFTLLLGLTMFLNFHPTSPLVFFWWWPVLLIGLTLGILFFPARILYWRSRGWLLYSLWRLFFAGLYAVEFRDFFLGDMFCSLTYSMQNIEVFFCLYARGWSDPEQCNSSHSRLLGFFSTLPGIWRALQCLRRYYDTRNAFPHLANFGKYMCTVLFYMSLSLFRIDPLDTFHVLFIFFGVMNSVYCILWDLVMDWSLCNPYAPYFMLRKDLGYKSINFYYSAMIIDPILRFNWLLYVLVPIELQHSALLSFLIAVSEVCRRGMWTLLRVENEHCTNVGRFRASRDVPLPYELDDDNKAQEEVSEEEADTAATEGDTAPAGTSASPAVGGQTPQSGKGLQQTSTKTSSASPATLRRRATLTPSAVESGIAGSPRRLNKVGNMLANAHAQDFERRKKPAGTFVGMPATPEANEAQHRAQEAGSSDEEDDEDTVQEHRENASIDEAWRNSRMTQ